MFLRLRVERKTYIILPLNAVEVEKAVRDIVYITLL